ncbi:unnamed protein product [Peronospora belbahrii]|uniref:J domain-containing protein n=1 Tax=Peronospora belbahrii TaxID=622444 RepID=A0AAU9LDG5_9STRA|nr:unnamed protein product [Peronospora belbahrii]
MLPRCFLSNNASASSRQRLNKTPTTIQRFRSGASHNVPQQNEQTDRSSVSTHSTLTRQQLEFCCLLCGWDVPCSTCPFNWFNFDPKKFHTKYRRQYSDMNQLAATKADMKQAIETLGISTMSMDVFARTSITQRQVKDAFRIQALQWHPDCNPDPKAKLVFNEILAAYELLLAHAC